MRTPRKPLLSPTKLLTYIGCAVEYKYIYVDKIGRFYRRAKPYYSFGAPLHNVLEAFHSEGAVATQEEITASVEQKWISAGYDTPQQEEEHRKSGASIVEAYHTSHQERAAQEIETIYTEKTLRADLGPFILTGRIDRIDQHPDGTLEIIDYKSGRWDIAPEEVDADLAMSCYQLLVRHNFPGIPVIATIYCLRSGNQATAQMDDEDIGPFTRDIIALGEEIIHREWEDARPERIEACNRCDFLERCERYWRYTEVTDFTEF